MPEKFSSITPGLPKRIEDHYLSRAISAENDIEEEVNLEKAELKDLIASYRVLQAKASQLANSNDGSQASEEAILDALLELDQFIALNKDLIKEKLGQQKEVDSFKLEDLARQLFNEHNRKTLNDYLDVAIESRNRNIISQLNAKEVSETSFTEENALEKEGLIIEHYDGLFLPPSNIDIVTGEGEYKWEEPRFDQIFTEFITLLKGMEIFTDDIITTKGKNPQDYNMMRQESYIKVYIPMLNRTVLLCNQVGEGTYIIYGYIGSSTLAELSKEDLKNHQSIQAVMIPRGETWATQVEEYLNTEEAWNKPKLDKHREKINLRSREWQGEYLGQDLKDSIPLEEYLEFTSTSAKRFRTNTHKVSLSIVASKLDIPELAGQNFRPDITLHRLYLAKYIWPEAEERINEKIKAKEAEQKSEELSFESLAEDLKDSISLEEYLEFTNTLAQRFRTNTHKISLYVIANRLDIPELAGQNFRPDITLHRLYLAKYIWPEAEERINEKIEAKEAERKGKK